MVHKKQEGEIERNRNRDLLGKEKCILEEEKCLLGSKNDDQYFETKFK